MNSERLCVLCMVDDSVVSLACDIFSQMEPDKHAPSSEHLHFSPAISSLHKLPRTSATFTPSLCCFWIDYRGIFIFFWNNNNSLLSFQRHKWDQNTLTPVGRKARADRAERWSNSRPGLSSCQLSAVEASQCWRLFEDFKSEFIDLHLCRRSRWTEVSPLSDFVFLKIEIPNVIWRKDVWRSACQS